MITNQTNYTHIFAEKKLFSAAIHSCAIRKDLSDYESVTACYFCGDKFR